jgi:hypothetical protein
LSKEIPTHKDILGNVIKVDDVVVYPSHNNLHIAIVKKINPKMINVVRTNRFVPDRKYPTDLLVVDDPKLSLYMLQHTK